MVPMVFVNVADPVGAGFVDSLGRPGGNVTWLYAVRVQFEREMAGTAQADHAERNAGGGSARQAWHPSMARIQVHLLPVSTSASARISLQTRC
jgi:hypothetical protein